MSFSPRPFTSLPEASGKKGRKSSYTTGGLSKVTAISCNPTRTALSYLHNVFFRYPCGGRGAVVGRPSNCFYISVPVDLIGVSVVSLIPYSLKSSKRSPETGLRFLAPTKSDIDILNDVRHLFPGINHVVGTCFLK